MMHGMSLSAAPATLTLADLYPGAAREMMIQTTNEKTTAAVPAATTGTAAAAASVITGATGLPPVIVWEIGRAHV